jgi:hypothetical protein
VAGRAGRQRFPGALSVFEADEEAGALFLAEDPVLGDRLGHLPGSARTPGHRWCPGLGPARSPVSGTPRPCGRSRRRVGDRRSEKPAPAGAELPGDLEHRVDHGIVAVRFAAWRRCSAGIAPGCGALNRGHQALPAVAAEPGQRGPDGNLGQLELRIPGCKTCPPKPGLRLPSPGSRPRLQLPAPIRRKAANRRTRHLLSGCQRARYQESRAPRSFTKSRISSRAIRGIGSEPSRKS